MTSNDVVMTSDSRKESASVVTTTATSPPVCMCVCRHCCSRSSAIAVCSMDETNVDFAELDAGDKDKKALKARPRDDVSHKDLVS